MSTKQKFEELLDSVDADLETKINALVELQKAFDAKQVEKDATDVIVADLKKQLEDAKKPVVSPVLTAPSKEQVIGFNIHLFSDPAYKDVDKVIRCLNDLNIKHVRQDFNTDATGKMVQHDDYVTRIHPLFKAAGIEVHPMVYLKGLSLNTTDLSAEYKKGFDTFSGFVKLYAGYFNTIEIGNENAIKVLLPNTAGDKKEHYSTLGLPAICNYIKGAYFGILSVNTAIKQYVSNEWIHTYFVYALRVTYGVCTYISHHMYSDGYYNIAKQPGWIGLTLTQFLRKNWGEACDDIGETNFMPTAGTPFTEQVQIDKFLPILKEIIEGGFNIYLFELLDRSASTGREAQLGFYKSDGSPKLIVNELKKILVAK